MTRLGEGNKMFYRKVLYIAVPVIFQNLISIGLNIIDTLMVGRVGVFELAAVGAANQIYFIFSMICYGLYSGAAIFTAQYWGAGDIPSIRKVLGLDYVIGGGIGILVGVLTYLLAPQLIWLFAKEPEVVELGTQYLRIACLSYAATAISYSISYNSRAVQRLKMPTVVNAAALLLNVFLNYTLIYGNFGMPRMGVRGAALATLIARTAEVLALLFFMYMNKNHPLAATKSQLLSFDKVMVKKVMKTAAPVMVSEGVWALATAVTFMAYGMLGAAALAVVQVASVINEFFQSFYFGVGNAAAVIMGEELGKRNKERAVEEGWIFLKIVLVLNLIITAFLIGIRGFLVQIYQFTGETAELLMMALLVWAIYLTPKMISYIFICGILRSGGDTHFTMKMDLMVDWLYGVPMAFFSVLVLKVPLHTAIALVSVQEIIRAAIFYKRFLSKKWIHIVID